MLPFRDNVFDLCISIVTLEHHYTPWLAVSEINRIIKHGGYFIGAVAFLEPYHGSYFHFSHQGLIRILAENNFRVIHLSPGWHGIEAMTNKLFNSNIGIYFRPMISFFIFLRRLIITCFKHFRNKEKWANTDKFIVEDRFRFAGSFIFKAVKL